MATTTNYGWTTPDDTSLVKDGAAAIRTLGSSVDTTTKALNPSTTLGDIEYRSSTANTNTRLPIGTTGQVLAVVGGVPAWATTADQTPLTTKGDIFTFTTVDARLGVGANGTVLTADSAEATGLKWAAPSGSSPSWSLLNTTTTTSGTSKSVTGLSGYNQLMIVFDNISFTSTEQLSVTLNNDTSGLNYLMYGIQFNGSASYSTNLVSTTAGSGAVENYFPLARTVAAEINQGYLILQGCNTAGSIKVGQSVVNSSVMGSSAIGKVQNLLFTDTTAVISSIQVKGAAGGTFDSGEFSIYGSVI